MATSSTLLCIHRDPAQLSLLEEHGYELVIAANGHEGLRLFMAQPVDAIVLEYHLGLQPSPIRSSKSGRTYPLSCWPITWNYLAALYSL